jgi:hypothetical protein
VFEGPGVKFNPKVGFILDAAKFNSSNLYSHYKCNANEESDTDEMTVIVQSGTDIDSFNGTSINYI